MNDRRVAGGSFEIRTLTLGEILDEAYVLFRGAVWRLVVFQLILFIPTAIVEVLAIRAIGAQLIELLRTRDEALFMATLLITGAGFGAVFVIQVLIAPVIGVGLTKAVADTYLSKKWTVGGLLKVTITYAGRAIGVGMVLTSLLLATIAIPAGVAVAIAYSVWGSLSPGEAVLVLVVFGLLAGLPAVAGAVYLSLRYALAFAALVVEDIDVRTALHRSAALMRGRYWSGLGLWLVLFLVSLIIGFAATMFVPSPSWETDDIDRIRQILPQLVESQMLLTIFSDAAGMFTRTYVIIAWTLFYFSERCRREGLDLLMLARRFSGREEP